MKLGLNPFFMYFSLFLALLDRFLVLFGSFCLFWTNFSAIFGHFSCFLGSFSINFSYIIILFVFILGQFWPFCHDPIFRVHFWSIFNAFLLNFNISLKITRQMKPASKHYTWFGLTFSWPYYTRRIFPKNYSITQTSSTFPFRGNWENSNFVCRFIEYSTELNFKLSIF